MVETPAVKPADLEERSLIRVGADNAELAAAGTGTRTGMQLFRSEVLVERQTQWIGTVLLAPRASHRLFTLVGGLVTAAILGLLFLADFTRTARVNGWLVPQEGVVRVYAPRPGVIVGLQVAEGTQVHKGEPLLTLSDELQSATLGATQAQIARQLDERRSSLFEERRQQERLLAQQQRALTDRVAALQLEQAQIDREIKLLKARVAIAARAEELNRLQFESGFISELRLQLVQSERLEQDVRLGTLERNRLTLIRERLSVEAELKDLPLKSQKEIAIVVRSVAQLEQERAEAEARREIVIPAPHDGTVTAIHAVPGTNADATVPLLSIVPPSARLRAHLYSPSRAVGFVRPGQRVMLRYQAYPYQRFGHHEGVVESVSRSSVSPGELPPHLANLTGVTGLAAGAAEPVYRITVKLASQSIAAYDQQMALQPGMLLEADVMLESRRLFEWVLDPLYTVTRKRQG
jgi:membrane fusion protein